MPTTKKFLQASLASIALAAVAASLFSLSGAADGPAASKTSATGKLAQTCGVEYNKEVYKELYNVFDKQAKALEKLGLGSTSADVCAQVIAVAKTKTDDKTDFVQYANATYNARAVLGAAVLYRTSLLGANIDKPTLNAVGNALDVPAARIAKWTAGSSAQKNVLDEGKAFVTSNLALGDRGDIDVTALKDPKLASYVYNLNLSP